MFLRKKEINSSIPKYIYTLQWTKNIQGIIEEEEQGHMIHLIKYHHTSQLHITKCISSDNVK